MADVSGSARVAPRMCRAVDALRGGCVGGWTRWETGVTGGGRVGWRMGPVTDALGGGGVGW